MTLSRIVRICGVVAHREPVHQLHQHLRRAHLGRVQPAAHVVDRLGPGEHGFELRRGQLPRIRQPRRDRLLLAYLREQSVTRDRHEQQLAPLFRGPDRLHLHPRCRGRERAVVRVDLARAMHDSRRPDDRAEVLLRRRNRRVLRQRRDRRRQKQRVRRVLAHEPSILGVNGLLGCRGRDGEERESGECDGAGEAHDVTCVCRCCSAAGVDVMSVAVRASGGGCPRRGRLSSRSLRA